MSCAATAVHASWLSWLQPLSSWAPTSPTSAGCVDLTLTCSSCPYFSDSLLLLLLCLPVMCACLPLSLSPQPASAGRVRGDMTQLSQELNRLEGKGYKAYRCTLGRVRGVPPSGCSALSSTFTQSSQTATCPALKAPTTTAHSPACSNLVLCVAMGDLTFWKRLDRVLEQDRVYVLPHASRLQALSVVVNTGT
jgi:hypothetical protein